MHPAHIMIIIGSIFLAGGALFTWSLIKRSSCYSWQWMLNFVLICFFLCSYIFAVLYSALVSGIFADYFYATLFLLGGLYVFLASYLSAKSIEKIKMIDDLKLDYEKIRYQAEHDKLTGCYNRHYLMEILDNRYRQIKLNGGHLTLMFIDLDGFKKINDERGHKFGDQMLQRFGQLLKEQLREEDIVARYGGDEFIVLVENINLQQAKRVGKKIIDATRQITKETLESNNIKLGCSIGVSQLTVDSPSIETVIEQADEACYKAKKNSRNIFGVDHLAGDATNRHR